MARVVASTGPGRRMSSEVQYNGDIPQSTLAAQLVNHLTDGKKHSKNQDKETYRQLLREVLSTENDHGSQAHTYTMDSDVDYKLIYVIVKAGLEKSTNDDPFDDQVERCRLVIDSLAVAESTLKRNPEVLVVNAVGSVPLLGRPGPLFLWLIPKLLEVPCQTQEQSIRDAVRRVLATILVLDRKLRYRGIKKYSILKYTIGCVNDFLAYLEAFVPGSYRPQHTSRLNIPSDLTISSVCPGHQLNSSLQSAARIHWKHRIEAVDMTVCLLSLVIAVPPMLRDTLGASNPLYSAYGWALTSLTRFWHSVHPEKVQLDHDQISPSTLVLFLEKIRSFFTHIMVTGYSSVSMVRFALLSTEIISTCLSCLPLPLPFSMEAAIRLLLIEIAASSEKSLVIRHSFVEHLLPPILSVRASVDRYDAFGSDLQHAISLFSHLNHRSPQQTREAKSLDVLNGENADHDRSGRPTTDSASDDSPRPHKRARLSAGAGGNVTVDARAHVLRQIQDKMGTQRSSELTGLNQDVINCHSKLSEEEQCSLYSSVGLLACASAQTLEVASSSDQSGITHMKCQSCDGDSSNLPLTVAWEGPELEEVFFTMVTLVKLPRAQKYRRPRVAAMLALKRIVIHTANTDHLDLAASPLGQWCLQALHSSNRELRVAASRTLTTFLRGNPRLPVFLKNRRIAIDFLRNLSEQSSISLQETCILAWGQIARVSVDDEMNLVLLRLVEYLGNTNPLLTGLAYDEIQRLAHHSPFSAMKLFAPYWRTIAVAVVQDLHRRPQVAQQVADLLAMSVSDFLSMTQVYTVPFFVLTKKHDILQRIADACGVSIMALCREHNNLAAILSCVLLRTSSDVEDLIMSLLNAVSPEFSNVDSADLLKSEPQATASELLKAAGESDEASKVKVLQALHFLAGVTHGKPNSSRGRGRKTDVTGPFFETHVLGIMALLADTINDGRGPQPILEKIRCLGAIREMVKLAKSHISNGLPQICACLRSAIENRELSNQGLDAWVVMMSNLGEDEIASLIDPTFAILVQYWEHFVPELQTRAYDLISHIMKTHAAMIRDIVHTLPSLASIPLMAKFEEELDRVKAQMDVKHHFQAFSQRCQSENATVVLRALNELANYLDEHQDFLHETANSEQPEPVVAQLARAVLDTSILFSISHPDIGVLCAKCLGLIGCLDPTRIEAIRDKRDILVLSNFLKDDETNDFVVFFLREILVKAFLSATNSRSQGFLAYAMQELLSISEIGQSVRPRSRDGSYDANYGRWASLPESVRTTLMPFVDSKYFVTAGIEQPPSVYPLYSRQLGHGQWLRTFTFDLLKKQVGKGKVQTIFAVLSRIVRFQDISISNFLLPFACLNVIINGADHDRLTIGQELLLVLHEPLPDQNSSRDNVVLCSQTVFHVLDYLSRWMQEKKKRLTNIRGSGTRTGRSPSEAEVEQDMLRISSVESVLTVIPADVISRRAVECKSFSRALFHWEQFIRQQRDQRQIANVTINLEPLYERLQEIYTQIDEPDGIEGISAHLHVLNIDQQVLEHRKAGRWTAAQSWYELQLSEKPDDLDVQYHLLTSLKESGQHDVLLNQIEGIQQTEASSTLSLPFAAEASWTTGKWDKLRAFLSTSSEHSEGEFNVGVGRALLTLSEDKLDQFSDILNNLRQHVVRGLSATNTASLQGCHDSMLKLHVLAEIEMISGIRSIDQSSKSSLHTSLNLRLDALGPFLSDKQYILGLRRAVMELSKRDFSNIDIASSWLMSAKLARKSGFTHQAFNAVLHASRLGDDTAKIEHSRLLWQEGHHRKAIQSLEGAIAVKAFRSHDYTEADESMATNQPSGQTQQNLLTARAHLLLAKWIDRAGQTQSDVIIAQYKGAVQQHGKWEKGHYYLGKHYNKLLESEKAKPPGKQAQSFINGETAKLVIENYLRSLAFGAKYIYQTLPRILTLWLDLGVETEQTLDPKYGNEEAFRVHILTQQRKFLTSCNSQIKKYIDRLPAFVFYTALSQLVARICHPSQSVYNLILEMVARVVVQHTPQALWTLLAVVKSSNSDRARRGLACMTRTLENARKARTETAGSELKALVAQGQKLSDQLLRVCEGGIDSKSSYVSLSKNLGFNLKSAPCKLAIPLEQSLTASLPTVTDNVNMRHHKAFNTWDYIHISSFLDEALVLNSLQRPRKISIRGSDGHVYALLCKPKDDLRKDQRLMEFNAMINRALKKDAESSKRRLYIKTYAVTPLNEECGLIEWIDNLRTLRDILLAIYKQKNVQINYSEIRSLLNESISAPNKLPIFTDRVIPHFPPVFHEWFVEMFPEPGAWFTARLRYTRSCAVMSIVGHVLGLGDRHGENILFEEGNGGTFHVDFNCLFDKGLTFEKPELVPFRLTHNMVDAFGAYGYEGPFRKSCELTLTILRQHEDTLMTILETFLYDPTTDFIGKKKKVVSVVPDTPEGVLESVNSKVKGLLPGESVPLSVEGYVQALIQQAVDPFKLASMYIGWCAFF